MADVAVASAVEEAEASAVEEAEAAAVENARGAAKGSSQIVNGRAARTLLKPALGGRGVGRQ